MWFKFFAVDSNDTLYGCDPKYLAEIVKLCQTIAEQILSSIKSLDTPEVKALLYTDIVVLSCVFV